MILNNSVGPAALRKFILIILWLICLISMATPWSMSGEIPIWPWSAARGPGRRNAYEIPTIWPISSGKKELATSGTSGAMTWSTIGIGGANRLFIIWGRHLDKELRELRGRGEQGSGGESSG
jgi:hypothetical protein